MGLSDLKKCKKKKLVQESHGTTFGGNPLAVASANATMDTIFQEDFQTEVQEKADFLKNTLEEKLLELPNVKEIRGIGFMIGIEVNGNVPDILKDLRSNGLIALSAGENVIRLLPPLTATKEELDAGIGIIQSVLKQKVDQPYRLNIF